MSPMARLSWSALMFVSIRSLFYQLIVINFWSAYIAFALPCILGYNYNLLQGSNILQLHITLSILMYHSLLKVFKKL